MNSFDQAKELFLAGLESFQTGNFAAAEALFREANALVPNRVSVISNLAAALIKQFKIDEARALSQQSVEIDPTNFAGWTNLGLCAFADANYDSATEYFHKALAINQDYVEALNGLGLAQMNNGALTESVASFNQAIRLDPNRAEIPNNLGITLGSLGRLEDAEGSYRAALAHNPDFVDARSNLLFNLNYQSSLSPNAMLVEAKAYGDLVARSAPQYSAWPQLAAAKSILRVGLVSGDLRAHPVGFFLEGILTTIAANPNSRLEFVAYSNSTIADELTERIKACCTNWHSIVGLDDQRCAQIIRDDGIGVLIDLSGHSTYNRLPLFALKPAPVQVSWLGYFATTGVAAIDYFIADPWTVPEGDEGHFTEQIWRLPETRICFTAPTENVEVKALPATSNGYVTFGCFNNLTKMNDTVVALWARILLSLPTSLLLLKSAQLGESSVRASVISTFARYGIEVDRLILEGAVPRAEYLAAYQRVDIALDPFPFTGGTTTTESLWMGVPVLTLAGDRLISRQGVGLLMNAGLPDWIATDAADYHSRAIALASDLPTLSHVREGLRQQVMSSPVFDAPRFARHFEAALLEMWCQRDHPEKLTTALR